MSFILDALRKSEHDRQRQSGPGLAEVPVAAPKSRTNFWATAAIALLVVNLLAVGVLLLRRADHHPTAPAGGPPAQPAAAGGTGAPAAVPDPLPPAGSQSVTSMTQPAPTKSIELPPSSTPYPAGSNPLAREVSAGPVQDVSAGYGDGTAPATASAPAARRAPTQRGGSVVYQQMPEGDIEPAAREAIAAANAANAADAQTAGMQTADQLVARGTVPALHMDLHVYGNRSQDRFIFVNSKRYKEGDTLAEGPVVEQITPTGAVLNQAGNRFLLTRD